MVVALTQFVDTVPLPLTDALVTLEPLFAAAARGARLITWSDDWHASWLALATWWFLCLAAPALFRYVFPTLLAFAIIWTTRRQQPLTVTESVLQCAITDLTTLRNVLLPMPPSISLPPIAILRAAAILTIPWLLISYFVSTRLLLALVGTLVFTYGAPWARVLRSILWHSAFLRTLFYRLRSFLTGQPLPKRAISNQPAPSASAAPVSSLRFLFTVYENQRWWMGLDWTAALLPAERPSWCSPSLHPVSPPNVFTLPDPTTVYLPTPDGNSRIKRTATWKWDEPEWRLLVCKEGSSLSRVERAPPSLDDPSLPSSGSTSSGNRLFKAAANKFKDPPLSPPRSSPPTDSDAVSQDDTDQGDSFGEPYTDPDGWIYGDNKWESQSNRGGLSKYTRYRRWTRVAIVSEIVEVVGPGAPGVHSTNKSMASKPETNTPTNTESSESKMHAQDAPTPSSTTTLPTNETESALRRRLRAALSRSSLPSTSA